jgi:serine/threonine protein kinase/tetratricopeptide (TPR) repeat protein
MEPKSVDQIFWEAAQIASAEERDAYLDHACADDVALRARVEQLLLARSKAEGFLEAPAPNLVATVDEPAVSERPGTVISQYKLMEQIGEGGMGLVFVAEQQHPVRRKVALKVIKPGMDTRQVVARFEAERQALALMDHPNIAKVHDGGETASGRPYFVMELVKGLPITEYCDHNQVPIRERLELFGHVCQAVQHAHQKGIIHHDIKPSNVLIMSQDGTPVVKVIDFGVAKAIGQQLTDKTVYTQFAQLVGTPLYMSPEQAGQSGVDVDTRSDIYSLGVLLYELLTGTTPFDKERLQEVGFDELRRIIREEEPAKPSTRISTLGQVATTVSTNRKSDPKQLSRLFRGELDWIVMKALEKDRNRRYETANAFAMDVQRYLADEPVLAGPPSKSYRLKKFVWRNRGPVSAGAVVLLALVAGIVGMVWGLVRAEAAVKAEKGAKETAQAREAETRAVLDFVEGKILAAARPEDEEGGLGAKVTLREAIEAALPFVETSFADQPLTEARLRMTVGLSFWYLGAADKAAEQFQKARRIRSEYLGPAHPDTLVSMNHLANSYEGAGREAEAFELREETLALRRVKLGPEHPDTLMSMNNLALSYRDLGRYADALKLREETLALCEAKLGPNHPKTLLNRLNLATSYADVHRHAEAVKLYEETVALCKAKLGPDHPVTLMGMNNLAVSYANLGRHADAFKLYEETLALRKAKLGPDNRDTLATMNGLALSYASVGRYADALKLHEETLRLRRAKLGPDHPDTAESLCQIGCVQALMIRKSSDGAKQAALAMEWLRKAVAAGFKDARQFKTDTDLDALRGREDFKQLLAELEAGKAKGKK